MKEQSLTFGRVVRGLQRRMRRRRPQPVPVAAASAGPAARLPSTPDYKAHVLLDRVVDPAVTLADLRDVLETALADMSVVSSGLYLNLGQRLLARGDVDGAMGAYVRASELDADNKFHAGSRLLDFVVDTDPCQADVRTIVEATEAATDFNVPDLFIGLIRRALVIEGFPLPALHGIARRLGAARVIQIGDEFSQKGTHIPALRAYQCAQALTPGDVGLRQQIGIVQFLAGNYAAAEREWALTDYLRRSERTRWGVQDQSLRFLGASWFPAIGHVAFLDTYIKSIKLGWRGNARAAWVYDQRTEPIGLALLKRWAEHIEVHGTTGDPSIVEKQLIGAPGEDERSHQLRREALTDEFWYGPDAQGHTRWYGPHGAAVEQAWKAEGRGPLLAIGEEEVVRTRFLLQQIFSLPTDAWFVCLHVREPGFHASWHKTHPGTRHAEIAAYDKVIDFVTARGGWVVRVGDPSMTPITPRPNVIDYAVSTHRNFELDVFLCATCSYFIGTNSGLSLVPPVFGRRCVLTNWSPIAIPNSYPDDIYIPKLIRDVKQNRHLTIREMYMTTAGWTQWMRDYKPGEQVIEDNDPDDLLDAVAELHAEVMQSVQPSAGDLQLVAEFNRIAVEGGSYVGSRIGTRFLRKYRSLLTV